MSVPTTAIRIWVECIPTATDDEKPVRLVLANAGGTPAVRLKFSAQQAWDSAAVLDRLLGRVVTATDTKKLSEAMRTAAIRVWSNRN